jgi:hypothetical protein
MLAFRQRLPRFRRAEPSTSLDKSAQEYYHIDFGLSNRFFCPIYLKVFLLLIQIFLHLVSHLFLEFF